MYDKRVHAIESFIKNNVSVQIFKNPFIKGFFLVGSGTAISQILSVAATPIITRLYQPSDFGVLAVYFSILTMLEVVMTLQYSMAIPLPKEDTKAANLLALCTLIIFTVSSVFLVLSLLIGDALLTWANMAVVKPYIWLILLSIIVVGLYDILNIWTIRKRDYSRITHAKLYQSFGTTLSKILLAFLPIGALGLLLGTFIGFANSCFSLGTTAWRKDIETFKKISFTGIRSVAMEYRRFPMYSSGASIMSALSSQVPAILIASLYGFQVAGYYSVAYMILIMPTSLIAESLGSVCFGEVSMIMRKDPKRLESIYLSTTGKLALIAVPMLGTIALIASYIFPVVLGSQWVGVGDYCLPLALVLIPYFVMSPTPSMEIYGFNKWQLSWTFFNMVSMSFGFIIGNTLGLSPLGILWIYGLTTTMSYIVCFFLKLKAIRKYTAFSTLSNAS